MTDQKTQFYFEIKDLSVGFRTFEGIKPVLNIEGLRINRGETYGLVGESGCGKTTVGRTVLRLNDISGGEVLFDGINVHKLSSNELRQMRPQMQIIFQDP